MSTAVPGHRPHRDRHSERLSAQFTGIVEGVEHIAHVARGWTEISPAKELFSFLLALHGAAKHTQLLIQDVRNAESS